MTDDAWELDALQPNVLDALIRDEVSQFFDPDIQQENRDEVLVARGQLASRMTAEWFDETMGGAP